MYAGEWSNDRKNGQGKFSKLSYSFEGQWRDDAPDGVGTATYADGSFYEGENRDDKRHGQGKYTYADGSVYEGQWAGGKKHGQGKNSYTSGFVLEGRHVDGKAIGVFTGKNAIGAVCEHQYSPDDAVMSTKELMALAVAASMTKDPTDEGTGSVDEEEYEDGDEPAEGSPDRPVSVMDRYIQAQRRSEEESAQRAKDMGIEFTAPKDMF